MPSNRFRIDWLLSNELAIGPAPRAIRHLDRLEDQGVKAILSLCSDSEAPPPHGLIERFVSRRFVLPDHRSDRLIDQKELQEALDILKSLRMSGPVYVHCLVAMERSPLVCLAWLVSQHGLSLQAALDYMMQLHPGTNPLPSQLKLLETFLQN